LVMEYVCWDLWAGGDPGHDTDRTGGGGSVQLGIHSDIVPKKKQKGKNATQKPSSEIDNTG